MQKLFSTVHIKQDMCLGNGWKTPCLEQLEISQSAKHISSRCTRSRVTLSLAKASDAAAQSSASEGYIIVFHSVKHPRLKKCKSLGHSWAHLVNSCTADSMIAH